MQQGSHYEVLVEGKIYPWDKESIKTSEIRSLGELPSDRPVIQMDLISGEENTVAEDQVLQLPALQEGKRFSKHRNFRRG
jgi:hypothetical protein